MKQQNYKTLALVIGKKSSSRRWSNIYFSVRLNSRFYVDFCEIVKISSRTMSLKDLVVSNPPR